jgi:drug/metabolite transporter (DMT)-like permease
LRIFGGIVGIGDGGHLQRGGRAVSATARALAESSAPLRGILIITVASLFFPVGDAVAKLLISTYDVLLILWLKYLVQTVFVAGFILATQPLATFKTKRPGPQIARGLAGIGSYGMFLTALYFIPLADAIAIEFTSPIFVAALAVPILGETVGARRWAAILVGLAGALLIVRPGLGVVHWAASLMLVAAMSFAVMQILSRLVAFTEHPLTTLFYTSLTALVVTTPAIPFVWDHLSGAAWGMMIAVGAIAGVCHWLLIRSFEFATASLLTPFTYAQIVGATVLGYLFFGDFPDSWTITGTTILVISGLYIAYREGRQPKVGT